MRKIIFSTTVFLNYRDEFLFLHRTGDVNVDKNKLNGIGGKLENGENFLEAAIRETKEETGYVVSSVDVSFCGMVRIYEGYAEDWTMCFFAIKVQTKKIPLGNKIKEGELIWMSKDKVLNSDYEVVDDLNYLWQYVVSGKQFFADFKINKNKKIVEKSISIIE